MIYIYGSDDSMKPCGNSWIQFFFCWSQKKYFTEITIRLLAIWVYEQDDFHVKSNWLYF